jgi:uncharacterized protein YkwD
MLMIAAAAWPVLVLVVLAICAAAARADEATAGAAAARADEASAAAACKHADVPFEAQPDTAREALLCEIARVRERRDRARLSPEAELETAAARHSVDMVERRYFSHVSPGGGELRDRVRRAGYARERCSWRAGEVLAWGVGSRSSPAATVRAWMDSPSHRRVIVSRRYRQVGASMVAGTPAPEHPSGVTVTVVLGDRDCSP